MYCIKYSSPQHVHTFFGAKNKMIMKYNDNVVYYYDEDDSYHTGTDGMVWYYHTIHHTIPGDMVPDTNYHIYSYQVVSRVPAS